jgi:hypothetical protein
MAMNTADNPEKVGKPSIWSQLTIQSVLGLAAMSTGLGFVVGYAISRHEPGLILAALLIQVGYILGVLHERSRARQPL